MEKILLRLYEKKISNLFDKVVFISDKEIHVAKQIIENEKIFTITSAFKTEKKIFKHKKNNYKILFVGNINYFPNKLACYNFARTIMPILKENYPSIEFNIVGKISFLDKFFLSRFQSVKVHGPLNNIEKIIKNSICGICNLKVATGLQMKIFTYLSYGLPVIASQKSFPKNILIKNKQIIVYKDSKDLVSLINKLIKNKKIANKISNNGFRLLKIKFNSSKVYGNYLKIPR